MAFLTFAATNFPAKLFRAADVGNDFPGTLSAIISRRSRKGGQTELGKFNAVLLTFFCADFPKTTWSSPGRQDNMRREFSKTLCRGS